MCFPKVEGRWRPFAVTFSGRLDLLSNKLRLLYWHGLPLESLPSDFYPQNIVAIDLSYSNIKQLWTTPKCLRRLKIMKLRHCCNLTTTPDFSKITNLEELDLEGCVNMVTVHPSIGMLKRLVVLNMRDCRRARSFPSKLEMDSLQVLDLSGCLNVNQLHEAFFSRWLNSIPGFIWNQQHPQRSVSLAGLHMLKSLNLSYCNLVQVPESIGGLSCLQELILEGNNLLEVPESIGGLSCLEELHLEGNNFTSLPGSLSQLSSLQYFYVDGCKNLEVLPELPDSVIYLRACDCTSLIKVLGAYNHAYLDIDFRNCPNLFTNLTSGSQGSISETQCLESSITSRGSTNQFSSRVIQNNICEFFLFLGSSVQKMDIIYHGNRIPDWFTNKSMGYKVKVELPLDWSFSKLRGFGVCIVFKRIKPGRTIGYSAWSFGGAYLGLYRPHYFDEYFWDKPVRTDESDMTWLYYTTKETRHLWNAKNFVKFCCYDPRYDVKEMGARVVCDEDLDQEADLFV